MLAAAPAQAGSDLASQHDSLGRPHLMPLLVRTLRVGRLPGAVGMLLGLTALVWTGVAITRRSPRRTFVATCAVSLPAFGAAAFGNVLGYVGAQNAIRALGPAITPKDLAHGELALLAPLLLVALVTLPAVVLAAYGFARDWPPREPVGGQAEAMS